MDAQILEEKQFLNYKEPKIYKRTVIHTFTAFTFTVAKSLLGTEINKRTEINKVTEE